MHNERGGRNLESEAEKKRGRQQTQLWWMGKAHQEEEPAKHTQRDNHEARVDWRTVLLWVAHEGANIKLSFLSHPGSEHHCCFYSRTFPVLLQVHTENYSWDPRCHRYTIWSHSTVRNLSLSFSSPSETLAKGNTRGPNMHHIFPSLRLCLVLTPPKMSSPIISTHPSSPAQLFNG